MARTITDGLQGIATADLSGLKSRLEKLRAEAEKALKLRADALARMSIDELLAALERAQKVT
jgi:ribosomal 50S subunit-associated protein YjgA (DUF615 family)